MQTIGIHKRDVVPSELTLDWCVDIVRTCGKRLSTICILANTKINHVSVANDAYEQLQVQLRRGAGGDNGKTSLSQSQQQNLGIDHGVGGVGGRDFLNSDLYSFDPRGSSSRRSSHQQNVASLASALVKPTTPTSFASPFGGLAVSAKEKRLILRIEAARAMLQEVATYIRHRLAEEEAAAKGQGGSAHMYTHDKDYSLYKAVGTMHHWLLADETLPAETEEQHVLMRLDDANANRNSSSYTAPPSAQVSIAALLVDKREVPRYSYGALLELISETDVGLLSREFFPLETLTDEAKRQLKEERARTTSGGLHWPPAAADGIEGCEALNEALTPPPLPNIRDEEDDRGVDSRGVRSSSSTSNRSPSRLSVSRERSPSAASPTVTSASFFSPSEFITPSFTQALQTHVRDIFRVWAQAMTTYFLHCEILEDMERQRAKREREMREQQKNQQQQAAAVAMAMEAAKKERERQERETAQLELEKKEKERLERELQQRKAEEEKEKEKAEEEARQRRLLKEREAAAEAVRHKLRLERIEQEAAAERERLAAEALELERERQRREEASRRRREQEEREREEEEKALRLRELRRIELEAEDEAHRLAVEEARRKRNEELARLEAERRRLAEEEQSIDEMRRRQLRAKEELAAEEETARLRAAALAAELREKELAAQLEKDRLARIAREAEQKRLEAEAEARRLAEEEEKAHNQRRKAAVVRKKRLDTLLSDVEEIEEPTDRSRIVDEQSSDRQWLSTLASQEAKAAAARERESKARREEEELRRRQRELDQAEERLRYRLARQKAEELERMRREEEERQRLAEHLEAQRSAVEHYEEAPSRREIEEEESLAWRESLLSKALINKEKALMRQHERIEREKAEALRRAQEAERLLREAKEAEAAEKKRRKEAEEEAERVRMAEELLEKERQRRIAAEREAEEERRRRREKEEEAAAVAAQARARVESERRLAALAAAKKKEQEEAEAQRQQQEQEEAEQRRSTSRLKAVAPRPMLISHCAAGETDEDSDDELVVVGDDGKVTRVKRGVGEGDDDLRRRVEALERGNRYLCEVVDGINTSHVRLHRHVLETTSTLNTTTTTTTTQNNNDANSFFGGGSSAAVSPYRASPQRGATSSSPSSSSSYVRNKTANVRMSRTLDPMYAEELPLPKTEELAIPRRIGGGGNASSSRSTSQFQTTQYTNTNYTSRRSDGGRPADNENNMYARSKSPAGNAAGPTEEGGQPKVPPPMTGSADAIHTDLRTPLSSPSRFARREGDGGSAVDTIAPVSKFVSNVSSASSTAKQYGSVADRIRHEVANARPSQRLKSKKPDDAPSENARREVGDEESKTYNKALLVHADANTFDPLINRDVIPRPTNEQRAAEREQLRKIDQLFATMVVTKTNTSPSPSPPSAHRPSTAGPTSARGSSTAQQRTISIGNGGGYGGGTVYGLGGWNMYDETGFSGAVGYLYDSSELDAPYLAVAASAPAWMHPRALQQAREDHLRQIQHAMYGDSLDASASPSSTPSSPSAYPLTAEELAVISARQRYEVRVVQQLIREIRSRGGLDPLFEIASIAIARDSVGAAASNAAYPHQHFPTAVPASLSAPSSSSSSSPALALLPEPCVKLDFSTMTPWIHDTHLLLILNALHDAAKALPDNAAAARKPRGNGYYSHPTRATHATIAYSNTGEQQRRHSNGNGLLDASELSNISHYSSYMNSLNTSAAHTAAEAQLLGSKARGGYVARQSAEELAANIAATVRIIDISKCHYVCSDTVLLVLSELVSVCPCLTTVTYNRERFGAGKGGEDGQSPSISRVARGPGTFATSPVRGHDTYPLSPDMRNVSRAKEGGDTFNSSDHYRKRPATASSHNRPSAADGGVGSSIFSKKTTGAVLSTPPRRSSYEFSRDPQPKEESKSSNSPLTILENALAERAIASARIGW